MTLYIDTGKIEDIKKYLALGVIRGVTTNPSIMLKAGVKGGMDGVRDQYLRIMELVKPLPVSLELTQNGSAEAMIAEAKDLYSLSKKVSGSNVNIKVPMHGPNGELENLEVITQLTKEGIHVNVTALMSAQQAYLAAQTGAAYVSLFCGRINDMGYSSVDEIRKLRRLLDANGLKSQIICASTREASNIADWLDAGGHIVTAVPDMINKVIVHPYTKETVQMFLRDAASIKSAKD